VPAEPPPSAWGFPDVAEADDHGVVGIGADLEVGTLLAAYRAGLFPMPLSRLGGPIAWWSPEPRGVLPLHRLRVSRSLRRSARRYEVRVDSAFEEVLDACADPRRPAGWISPSMRDAYLRLHHAGWVHSVEAWDDDGLAGGLYGVAVDGLFAGESMFHRRRDASKAALIALVEILRHDGDDRRLLDVQWTTPHLQSLGAVDVPRAEYLGLLAAAREAPLPPCWR